MRFFRPALQVVACGIALFVFLPVLTVLEPFVRIRLTHFPTARLGEMCVTSQIYLSRLHNRGPEPRTKRFIYGAVPCNRALFDIWKRYIKVYESRALSALFNYASDFLFHSRFFTAYEQQTTYDYELVDKAPVLRLTAEETERGQAFLRKLGIGPDDWFICFQARDSAYHVNRGVGDGSTYRNCDVRTYMKAARYIADLGGYAVRIGRDVAEPLGDTGNPRIIDFSTQHYDDFGDTYLMAACRFLLGSATGNVHAPPLFNKPVAIANHIPVYAPAARRQSLHIPKFLQDAKTGKILPYSAVADKGMYDMTFEQICRWDLPKTYAQEGLTLIDNSEDDILDLCMDMLDSLEGRPVDPEGARIQQVFKRRFFSAIPGYEEHAPNIGPRFAVKYRHLIEG